MKRFLLTACLQLLVTTCYCQWAIPPQMRATNTLDRMSGLGASTSDLLYGLPLPPGGVKGSIYLNERWNHATIMLYESEKLLEGYPVMYNLKDEELEVRSKSGVKVIESRKVKSMVWQDSLTKVNSFFINGKEYEEDGVPLTGLLEVVSDGKLPLIKKNWIVIKAPDYVAAFDVGSRDSKVFRKNAFYYASGKVLNKITNKKTLMPAFGDDASAIESFIKVNKLSVGRDQDLFRIFEHYNSKNN